MKSWCLDRNTSVRDFLYFRRIMGDLYISVDKDYKPNDIKYREAAHVMFFARTNRKLRMLYIDF